ncbi:MAG: DUF3793 family protein, partial [Treponema sp.]|nr:DUF3793 family protein [Treponema sp.]
MRSSDLVPVDTAFETLLARYGAPVLLGKKPAALFAVPQDVSRQDVSRYDMSRQDAGAGGLRFLNLRRPGHGPLVFAFRPRLLEATLENPQVRRALEGFGYPVSGGLEALLRRLDRRVRESPEFPHEIGFFLGYPPHDVLGFIDNRGAGSKLGGPWKVYDDVEGAAALFKEYAHCKRRLLDHLGRG